VARQIRNLIAISPAFHRTDLVNLKGKIPTENGNLSSLYHLSLLFNELSGSIPTELCNLQSIAYIELSQNLLTGELPSCLGTLSDMRQLFLDDNMLTGDPSGIFSSLPVLEVLVANNNSFTGVIDSTLLANSRDINWVDLSHNGFTSNGIPLHLFSLPQLEILDLSQNRLAGRLPTDIPENFNLTFLALYDNALTGHLPASLSNLKGLYSLDLSNNSFVGPMDVVGAMPGLVILFLSDNPFESGPVPQSFANLTNLNELSLRNTNRNGTLPDFIGRGNFTNNLQVLDLGSNALEGAIPATYGEQPNLLYLLLNDNSGISGQIPPSFSNLTQLVGGYFDGTGLNGNMSFMCKLPNFQTINGDEGLFADCGDPSPEINCTCCVCCTSGLEGGCSRPLLSNLDVFLAVEYRIRRFDFRNDTVPPQ
jgi:Leucine-rich repeat (LRR) protein